MPLKIKGFGWRRDLNDVRDYTPETPKVKNLLINSSGKEFADQEAQGISKKRISKASGPLPPSIDNRKWCSPIENQGQLGSCTANAGTALYEYMERKAYGGVTGKYINASRLFLYKTTRFLMGQEGHGDSGAYIRTTLGAIRMFGVPPEEFWPYTDKDPEFDLEPPGLVTSMAQNWQSVTQFRLDYSKETDKNIQRMKEYLAKGYAMMMGFAVFSSYSQAAKNGGCFPYPSQNEQMVGGHAVLIVGYDDGKTITNQINGVSTVGAFLIQNSWSENWGDRGFGWIPYDYFHTGANGDVLADDVWTITKLEWLQSGEFFW